MKQMTHSVGDIKEYIFSEMDYMDGVLTLQEKETWEEISGTVAFGYDGITLTTRGYEQFEILAIIPEDE